MTKRLIVLLLALALLAMAVPALAQVDPWFTYIYNGQTKELVRVYQDGTQQSFNLGLDANTFISPFDMAFNYSGTTVAFCTVVQTGDGTPGAATLTVRDIEAQTNLQVIDVGTAIGCRTGQAGYGGMMDSVLSVSIVRYSLGIPGVDTTQPIWEIRLYEPTMGMQIASLNANSPEAAALVTDNQLPVLPYVQRIDGSSVIFAVVPYGIGGGAVWPSYRWTLNGAVEPVTVWGNIGLDTLSLTDEKVWADADPNRPAVQPYGPMPANNIVKIADRDGNESVIFYTADSTVLDADFIESGRRVAVKLVAPVDEAHLDQQVVKWVAVDRLGNVSDLYTTSGYAELAAAPDGFIVMDTSNPTAGSTTRTFSLIYGTEAGQTTLWSLQTDDFSQVWELAWAAPTADDGSIQRFAVPQ